jgi:hypothetical protein
VKTRGLCATHYHQAWREGRIAEHPTAPRPEHGRCSVEGCSLDWAKRGLCHKHYNAAKRNGQIATTGPCTIDGCGRREVARGLCANHYQVARSAGTLEQHGRRRPRPLGRCSERECPRNCFDRGLCRRHWRERVNAGTLSDAPICAAKDCKRSGTAGGYCVYHQQRLRTGHQTDKRAPRTTRRVSKDGYVWITRVGHPMDRDSRGIMEHRALGGDALGRPLLRSETVHHRNGVRTENTIGPCFLKTTCDCPTRHNLELWTRSQPSGQRVADKLAWAHEIIALYGKAQQRLFV